MPQEKQIWPLLFAHDCSCWTLNRRHFYSRMKLTKIFFLLQRRTAQGQRRTAQRSGSEREAPRSRRRRSQGQRRTAQRSGSERETPRSGRGARQGEGQRERGEEEGEREGRTEATGRGREKKEGGECFKNCMVVVGGLEDLFLDHLQFAL